METLVEGSVLMLPTGAYVLLRARYDVRRSSPRMLLRELETAFIRTMPYSAQSWVSTLRLSDQTDLRAGDIALYPGQVPEDAVVVIRGLSGWMRTAAPWTLSCDAEMCLHLLEGRARIINRVPCAAGGRRGDLPLGSVVACRDTADSTVWIRTREDYWVSSTRGVTASDLMINYELDRRIYQTVWVPEEDR